MRNLQFQQFLHEHNEPLLSFYEQMMREKSQLEAARRRDLQLRQREEVQPRPPCSSAYSASHLLQCLIGGCGPQERLLRAALLQRQETLLAADPPDLPDLAGAEPAGDAGPRPDFRLLWFDTNYIVLS